MRPHSYRKGAAALDLKLSVMTGFWRHCYCVYVLCSCSPLYGAPSSNHPELALPYFDALVAALPLARRRASRQPWPGGGHPGRPGLPGQQADEYTIEDKGGYVGVNYPYDCFSYHPVAASLSVSKCFHLGIHLVIAFLQRTYWPVRVA